MIENVDGVNIIGARMASPRDRIRADGSVAYQALYRLDGKQTSTSFANARSRDRFIKNADRLGIERALEIVDSARTTDATESLQQTATRYIETRTGIKDGTRAKYRSYLKNDFPKLIDAPIDEI